MSIPIFPETDHPLLKPLSHCSDLELLTSFQRYSEQGKYFTAIFCRYSAIVYTLIGNKVRSPVQADYLFAFTWRHIFYEMRGLVLPGNNDSEWYSFQNWVINMTMICLQEIPLPPVESINYSLKAASPPLWCYLEQGLSLLPPVIRLILVLRENFHWSYPRISAYLKAEGKNFSPQNLPKLITKGHELLEKTLPKDIRVIYLTTQL